MRIFVLKSNWLWSILTVVWSQWKIVRSMKTSLVRTWFSKRNQWSAKGVDFSKRWGGEDIQICDNLTNRAPKARKKIIFSSHWLCEAVFCKPFQFVRNIAIFRAEGANKFLVGSGLGQYFPPETKIHIFLKLTYPNFFPSRYWRRPNFTPLPKPMSDIIST